MAGRSLTRVELANAIHREAKVSRAEAAVLLDQILDEMVDAMERGESVRLSSFGTFAIRDKKERLGRNPKTGQQVPINARRVVTFKASDVLKRFVNGIGHKEGGR